LTENDDGSRVCESCICILSALTVQCPRPRLGALFYHHQMPPISLPSSNHQVFSHDQHHERPASPFLILKSSVPHSPRTSPHRYQSRQSLSNIPVSGTAAHTLTDSAPSHTEQNRTNTAADDSDGFKRKFRRKVKATRQRHGEAKGSDTEESGGALPEPGGELAVVRAGPTRSRPSLLIQHVLSTSIRHTCSLETVWPQSNSARMDTALPGLSRPRIAYVFVVGPSRRPWLVARIEICRPL
jgi:hypothetical protein